METCPNVSWALAKNVGEVVSGGDLHHADSCSCLPMVSVFEVPFVPHFLALLHSSPGVPHVELGDVTAVLVPQLGELGGLLPPLKDFVTLF